MHGEAANRPRKSELESCTERNRGSLLIQLVVVTPVQPASGLGLSYQFEYREDEVFDEDHPAAQNAMIELLMTAELAYP
jgi:hypothetical protein